MKKIIIEGNKKLTGTINIGGAKNSVVALMPAALLSNGKVKITNVPNISDRDSLIEIIEFLGGKISVNNSEIEIDTTNVENKEITRELSKKLRASYYFMGVLLAKYKKVEIYIPGGCRIGARPIDLHLEGFKALGAKITEYEEKYTIEAEELIGTNINLGFASVGATKNLMFAATGAKGITTINNAAKEVEVINIGNLLISMGVKITGLGTSTITIEGKENIGSAEIEVMPDRIESGTYVIIGALIGENLKINGFIEEHNKELVGILSEMNIPYKLNGREITISSSEDIRPVNIKSLPYPGFPTDLGQPMHVLMTQANGISNFCETIYENRTGHVKYLNKMGANITVENTTVHFNGPTSLIGKEITALDLRGGAALVLAGLIAEGTTVINDVDYILRGYENIINKLTNVGAKINIEEI